MTQFGPKLPISEEIHSMKYRANGESFKDAMSRIANSLADDKDHYFNFRDILLNQRFLPAGRIQSSVGASREVTPFNCYVSGTIEDSSESIMLRASEAFQTMRLGGGIGYDFSNLRPRGDRIKSLDSPSSGPLSFMDIFDTICATVSSAGHRRGAQMGVLRVDHPDIEDFIRAKQNSHKLTNFNISIAVTDKFMECLKTNTPFPLVFNGVTYKTVNPSRLWDEIMRSTWNWAEPGVLFIDTINKKNNLWYCETISATNPCAEQPLPPYGACLLGSFNLTKYCYVDPEFGVLFSWAQFIKDIPHVVRAIDNVIDQAIFPLPQQAKEAMSKRRMGLGLTGVANVIESSWGFPYGSKYFLEILEFILTIFRNSVYDASIDLAKEKGSFELFSRDDYLKGSFIQTLPETLRDKIREHGIRNSHLLSIAPTGTISLTADNISSGIEPVFTHEYTRTINTYDGPRVERVTDYAYREWGIEGKTADKVTPEEHVSVLNLASKYVDSAVSKTCNIGDDVSWEDFKNVYLRAYEGGSSGCTTFRAAGKRYGILNATVDDPGDKGVLPEVDTFKNEDSIEGTACTFDPSTGRKTCE